MITLKEFQQKKVYELCDTFKNIIKNNSKNKIIIFQAPTGSGKTVMMAKFINEIIFNELPEEDLCFLWISIGKGDLHKQTYKSLRNIFDAAPNCYLLEEKYHGYEKLFETHEVVIVNWEKLRAKDNKTGEWKNRLMRDGELINFREIIQNTKLIHRKIIVIIDESHIGTTAERTKELREIIDAELTIEVSATPTITITSSDIKKGNADHITVAPDDVIEAGMIKKKLLINSDISILNVDENTSQDIILEAAYEKRLEILKAYQDMGVNIDPLVLIQLPNADEGSVKKEFAEKFLGNYGIKESNQKLAIWLSEEKTDNIDLISKLDNPIEFLIFKQAIDTGWDCPRACILVKFRETHSIVFEIQTVGRILRMPEQKHYENELLNTGFIYTNTPNIEVAKNIFNPNYLIKNEKTKIKEDFENIKLKSYYKSRIDYGDITSSFHKVLDIVFCRELGFKTDFINFAKNTEIITNLGYDFKVSRHQEKIIFDTSLDTKELDDVSKTYTVNKSNLLDLKLSDGDILIEFNKLINNCLGEYVKSRSTPTVREAFYMWFIKYFGIKPFNNGLIKIQSIVIHPINADKFSLLLSKAIAEYKPYKLAEIKEKIEKQEKYFDWEIPKEEYYNSNDYEKIDYKLNVYQNCYLQITRSAIEIEFEKYIETQTQFVEFWYKNGDNGKNYFGIKYIKDNLPHTFYPDYIIKFKDKRIGIFDTKSGITAETAKEKAECLQTYISTENINGSNLFGGIIIIDNSKQLRINQQTVFEYNKNNLSTWNYLNDIIKF